MATYVRYVKPSEEAPCKQACPAGVDVPRYIRLIGGGKFDEAVAVIREKIPFPLVCGYVCFHPCETRCRLNDIGESVAINALKRFAAEKASFQERPVTTTTGKRVAVIGSGPAGLTAAYYLAKVGHGVTVFEGLSEPGGMMRWGIPAYRLPKDLLAREINMIKDIGIDIKINTRVNSLDGLFEQGYDAIFVAVGAQKGVKMGIEGEEGPGVLEGLSFLEDINSGKKLELGRKVAVIGGGNTAVDAARTALRLGSHEVTILYRRGWNEMPANPSEIERALNEEVDIRPLVAPLTITSQNGGLRLECTRMRLVGPPDASGRRRPIALEENQFTMKLDTVIVATGEMVESPAMFHLASSPEHTIQVDPDTLATSRPGVFAGGDAVSGPASVIKAIAAGRKAAASMAKYLGGQGLIKDILAPPEEEVAPGLRMFPIGDRAQMPTLSLRESVRGFAPVDLGLSEEAAIEEAKRCLRCDLPITVDASTCTGCFICILRCSHRFEKAFKPTSSKIKVMSTIGGTYQISFTDECDNCGICARYCFATALVREKTKNV